MVWVLVSPNSGGVPAGAPALSAGGVRPLTYMMSVPAGTTAACRIGELGAPIRLTWAAAGVAAASASRVAGRMNFRMNFGFL